MDLRLPLLADANLHLGIAEEAAGEHSFMAAANELDKAQIALSQLDDHISSQSDDQQTPSLMSQMIAPLKAREEALVNLLPSVVSQGEVVVDPEQESDPEQEGNPVHTK